jgi:tRNA modification GTPase
VHGAFRRAVDAVRSSLRTGDLPAAEQQLAALDRHAPVGRHLTTPWRVVIAGAPNVGKSSLVNALAGFQRSIVAPTPGTTRDLVTTLVAFDGWPVELADTAGVRARAESLEAEGIGLALESARMADLCLWIVDASAPPVWPDSDMGPVMIVVNKIDLPPAWDRATATEAIAVSALTGAGIPGLANAIAHKLVPDPPAPGTAVLFTHELADGIAHCRAKHMEECDRILTRLLR